MLSQAFRAIEDPNEHFEPTAKTKKAWAATEQQDLDGRHSGLFGKQALTGVFLVFALAAEVWGAYSLAQMSGYSFTLTAFAPVLWCIIWAFVGHIQAWKDRLYTVELEVVEGRENEEDRSRAAKLRALLLPWTIWRWVARVPILVAPGLFYYFYDAALRGRWSQTDYVILICYVLAAVAHMFKTGPALASAWFWWRLRSDYGTFSNQGPNQNTVTYSGSSVLVLGEFLSNDPFRRPAECAPHWMTSDKICTTGLLTDHQVQTLTNNCPSGKDEAKRQLRLRQIKLFYDDPIRDGEIHLAPGQLQLPEGGKQNQGFATPDAQLADAKRSRT